MKEHWWGDVKGKTHPGYFPFFVGTQEAALHVCPRRYIDELVGTRVNQLQCFCSMKYQISLKGINRFTYVYINTEKSWKLSGKGSGKVMLILYIALYWILTVASIKRIKKTWMRRIMHWYLLFGFGGKKRRWREEETSCGFLSVCVS